MNARSSAYHTFCIYWSALALVVISLGQEREDVLIRVSAHEGVGQGKSKCSKWFFTNGFIGFPSEGLGEFLDDKSKDKRDGGRLIYYHVRLGLFIKPQMLVAQLWHAEWWLDVEDDESHALYGGLSFFLPSVFISPSSTPLQHPLSPTTTSLPSSELHQISIFPSPVIFFWSSRCWSERIFCKEPTSHNSFLYPTTTWGVGF